MDNKIKFRKWLRQGLLIFGIYTLLVLITIFQQYSSAARFSRPYVWATALVLVAVPGYTWALLTPVIAYFGRLLPITRRKIFRNLTLHLGFATALAILHRIIFIVFQYFFAPETIRFPTDNTLLLTMLFLTYIFEGIFSYISIATIYQAYWHFREAQDREFRLQQAELQALKTQLHPHFLFNTLNAISALSFTAPEIASRVIAQLSDLLRFSLKTERAAEITLKEELDFVRKYLQIQQTLLEERLEIKWDISPDTLDACVPNMFLQPLVENSIRHGIAPKEIGGSIEIKTQRVGETLEISVRDNGLGISSNGNKTSGDGIGLSNTRARLRHLYGEAHEFQLGEPDEGGVLISMTIPFREGNTNEN